MCQTYEIVQPQAQLVEVEECWTYVATKKSHWLKTTLIVVGVVGLVAITGGIGAMAYGAFWVGAGTATGASWLVGGALVTGGGLVVSGGSFLGASLVATGESTDDYERGAEMKGGRIEKFNDCKDSGPPTSRTPIGQPKPC